MCVCVCVCVCVVVLCYDMCLETPITSPSQEGTLKAIKGSLIGYVCVTEAENKCFCSCSDKEIEKMSACVCVCVCERDRERERERSLWNFRLIRQRGDI